MCTVQPSLAAVLPLSSFLFGLRYLLSGKHSFEHHFCPKKALLLLLCHWSISNNSIQEGRRKPPGCLYFPNSLQEVPSLFP